MTDVLEQSGPADPGPATPPPGAAGGGFALSGAGRVGLASLAASAGAIHFAMVPSHMADSSVEGLGFALVAWIQVVTAVLLLTRASRGLLRFTMVSTVAFLGVWAISRTYGLPFGDHPWHPHDASFVDLVGVGIEIALVLAAGVWLSRPTLGQDWDRSRLIAGGVAPLAVVVLATAAIASPSARNHADDSHGGHGDTVAAGSTVAADGHGHGAPAGSAGAAAVAAASADDNGLSQLENGHQHGGGEVKLDPATQTALSQQLNQLSTLVAKYPTIAAAEAAGYRRAGPFSPGLGTHYGGLGNRNMADDTIQGVDGPMVPMLVFDGTDPQSPLAGFMFLSFKGGRDTPPEGFIGPNDHWHFHTNTCIVTRNGVIEAPLGADRDVDIHDCRKVGGSLISTTTNMVHVWAVPGYESSRGVFSEINPKITCPDGSYHAVRDVVDFGINRCKSARA